MVVATKFKFGSRLHKRNVLMSLTFIVLNGNHLVRFVIEMLVYVIYFLRVIKD